MRIRTGLRLVSGTLFASVVSAAQSALPTQAQTQSPAFHANVDVVQLDVSVLGKDGMPVKGLGASDFTILEDGKRQKIVAFDPVDVADAVTTTPSKPAAWTREVSPDVVTNQYDNRRLVVIAMDDATIVQGLDSQDSMCGPPQPCVKPTPQECIGDRSPGPFAGPRVGGRSGGNEQSPPVQGPTGNGGCPNPGAEMRAQEAARLVIDELGPNDLASVTFTDVASPPQDFTADRVRLNAAVDRFKGHFEPTCLAFQRAESALKATIDYLASVQNRRKTLVYIGAGVPVDFDYRVLLVAVPDQSPACGPILMDMMKDVFISAQRANVAIYTIDPFGLRTGVLPVSGSLAELNSAKIMAANTGGRAILDTNDFSPGIIQMFRENSSYYMLGYASSNTKQDGTFRRIEVKVDRPGLEVRTRKNYYAADATKVAAVASKPQPSQSVQALSDILPKADVPLVLTTAPFVGLSGQPTLAVVVGVTEPSSASRSADDIEVSVAALDPFGAVKATWQQTMHATLTPGANGTAKADVTTNLALEPGDYEILVGASSHALGKTGGVYTDVTMPNFAKAALTMSGVVLSTATADSSPATPGALLPVAPTTQRTFASTDRVSAFFRIYEGGTSLLQPIACRTHVTDGHDAVVSDVSEAIGLDRFDAAKRSADAPIDVPLARLGPGQYLLTIEATMGRLTAERDVVFTVR